LRFESTWFARSGNLSNCTVLALNFGHGAAFFSALSAWQDATNQSDNPTRCLNYIAVLPEPPSRTELLEAWSNGPDISRWQSGLLENWPSDPLPGLHQFEFANAKIRLTLVFYPLLKALVEIEIQADVIDARGAEILEADDAGRICKAILVAALRHLNPNGVMLIFAALPELRDTLTALGLQITLVSEQNSEPITYARFHPNRAPASMQKKPVLPKHIAIIGAGIAGLGLAFVLANRAKQLAAQLEITIIEARPGALQATSAAPLVLLHPASGVRDSIEFNLQSYSFRSAVRQLTLLCGAQNPPWMQAMPVHELRKNGRSTWHEGYVIDSQALAQALLAALTDLGVNLRFGAEVNAISISAECLQIQLAKSSETIACDALYVCNARAAELLLPELTGAMDPICGQLELLAPEACALNVSYCGALNVLPGPGALAIGNSFEPFVERSEANERVRYDLMTRAEALLDCADLKRFHRQSWVGIRAQAADRKPIIGYLNDAIGLSLAHGSKGFSSGFLAAEILTAALFGDVQVVPERVRLAVAADRFRGSILN
jgi:glycine/D-amino acid oxidase-like deaminating enzyme